MYVSEQKNEKMFRVKFYSMKVGCDGLYIICVCLNLAFLSEENST